MSATPSDKADDTLVDDGPESANEDLFDDDTQHVAQGDVQTVATLLDGFRVDKTSLSEGAAESREAEETYPEACPVEQSTPVVECPVCLQIASFPVKLPCTHIFCFLCVKGFANRSKRCALCRQEIPADFFNDPKLIRRNEVTEKSKTIYDEGYQWFYEGRNGWWQYDDRTSVELERRYKDEDKVFELLIAGFLYVIDLENMKQFRRNDQTRKRRIKRDMQNIPGVKGIAGLKFSESQPNRPNGDGESSQASGNSNNAMAPPTASSHPGDGILTSVVNDTGPTPADDAYLIPPAAPNNTPQTPMTPADSQPSSLYNSTEDLSLQFQSHMHLSDPAGSSRNSPTLDNTHDLSRNSPILDNQNSLSRNFPTLDEPDGSSRYSPALFNRSESSRSSPILDNPGSSSRNSPTPDDPSNSSRNSPTLDSPSDSSRNSQTLDNHGGSSRNSPTADELYEDYPTDSVGDGTGDDCYTEFYL